MVDLKFCWIYIKFGIVIVFIETGLGFNIECCVWSYSKEAESLWSDDILIDMIQDNYMVVVPQMEGGWKVSKFLISDDELGLKIQTLVCIACNNMWIRKKKKAFLFIFCFWMCSIGPIAVLFDVWVQ